jgi:hypothetical protein
MISKVGTLGSGLLFLLYLAASNGVARSAPLAGRADPLRDQAHNCGCCVVVSDWIRDGR